jgi:hypothetical protein
MPRPYIGPQIAVRLETEALERVDKLIPAFATTVHEPTRAEVVRAAVLAGLPVLEREAAERGFDVGPAEPKAPKRKPR